MNPLIPLCFLGILIGIGVSARPMIDRAVVILNRKRKEMYEEARLIRVLIDNEMNPEELIEAWYVIHEFYRSYRFIPMCKAVTGRLHSYRLNRLMEIRPTTKYKSKESILRELHIEPEQVN